jgi:WD40 repeat protein
VNFKRELMAILHYCIVLIPAITDRVISEHTRAVNRVCFQPNSGFTLLSASQDGNIKAWVGIDRGSIKLTTTLVNTLFMIGLA